jgi:hypothetical protein
MLPGLALLLFSGVMWICWRHPSPPNPTPPWAVIGLATAGILLVLADRLRRRAACRQLPDQGVVLGTLLLGLAALFACLSWRARWELRTGATALVLLAGGLAVMLGDPRKTPWTRPGSQPPDHPHHHDRDHPYATPDAKDDTQP